MKHTCTTCNYFGVNTQSDETYCLHPDSDDREILFDYPQQKRPVWCPLEKKEK